MNTDRTLLVSPYPFGKEFAFTIIDDTDRSTLETSKPLYDYLSSIGLRTTKTVWVKEALTKKDEDDYGDTTERQEYLRYVQELQNLGFEIALHNVSSDDNKRDDIISGIETFKAHFGHYPRINVMHDENKENLYFDAFLKRGYISKPFYGRFLSAVYKKYMDLKKKRKTYSGPKRFFGELESSLYFWGDICKEKIKYIRSYISFPDINTLKCNPNIPYYEMEKPYVNYWFDSSNGEDRHHFNELLAKENVRKLIKERGCSIVYTHFGRGFVKCDSKGNCCLNDNSIRALDNIAAQDGWFVPVSDILDRLEMLKNLAVHYLNGILLANLNDAPIEGLTICASPNQRLWTLSQDIYQADGKGNIIIDRIMPNQIVWLMNDAGKYHKNMKLKYWTDRQLTITAIDIRTLINKIANKMSINGNKVK
ncbi:conserved hypothetical protein [uncultured Desulfobacterium sp.]|uniref:Uncharacterized protein n=1 Tax=uncultured Desulfobacterium sp. TaxID=201089 RepID=A0A445MZV7_9BACT|nr:conserved hypothetical protein [uncultured Desulfobacterium sp.]